MANKTNDCPEPVHPANLSVSHTTIRVGDVEIDPTCFEIRRGNTTVSVEPRVFDFMLYLAQNSDRVITKRELVEHVWGGCHVSDGALARCASLARKAVGNRAVIVTIHRRGYRWCAPGEHLAMSSHLVTNRG